jgi:hypothetical protein
MAGTAERTLALKLIADVNGLKKPLAQGERQLGKFTKSVVSWGKAFTGALVINGIERLANAAIDGVKAFRQERAIVQSFNKTVKNLGLPVKSTTRAMDAMADRALHLGFDDAQTIQGLNQFLKITGDIEDANKLMALSFDISRSRGIDHAAAMKIAQGIYKGSARTLKDYGLEGVEGMEAVSKAAAKERNQAKAWARNHPFEVQLGKIGDTFADVVGSFATGDFKGVQAGIAKLGKHIHNALFGFTRKDGTQVEGLTGKLGAWGKSMADGIIKGIGETDWGAKLGEILNAAAGAVSTAASNGTLTNIGILGGVVAATIFAVDMFITAVSNMFKAPAWIGNKLLTAAIKIAAVPIGVAFAGAAFVAETFAAMLADTIKGLIGVKGWEAVTGAARGIGTKIGTAVQLGLIGGLTAGLLLLVQEELKKALDPILPDHPLDNFDWTNPDNQKRAAGGPVTKGRPYVVGEKRPELFVPNQSGRILPRVPAMGTAGGGGRGGGSTANYSISVHVAPGGDLVEAGRQTVRAIQEYEKRGGKSWRN